ncbi:hypothetical protein [Agromyces salentinus]|uniref:hypothetical protein n=1 Tax=Agromyces salentinus TaxID=269421 RepID=UPI0012F7A0F2|nr:hypothetical protein [Agromyces salentinus]
MRPTPDAPLAKSLGAAGMVARAVAGAARPRPFAVGSAEDALGDRSMPGPL